MIVRLSFLVLAVLILGYSEGWAEDQECIYMNSRGEVVKERSLRRIPVSLRAKAKCYPKGTLVKLVRPDQVKLDGNVRRQEISSNLGKVELRWPRSVETLFGTTPVRAVTQSARAVSKALKRSGFPSKLWSLDLPWNIVFMDENVPDTQIPAYLVSNCHPAWIVAPANMYVVGQRVVAGCHGGQKMHPRDADSYLSYILMHEMGHAVEYQLHKSGYGRDRMRSEGFATWFAHYVSKLSSLTRSKNYFERDKKLAKSVIKRGARFSQFGGSGSDYARASMIFHVVESYRGVAGVMAIYEIMEKDSVSLFASIQKSLHWTPAELEDRVRKFVGL